MRLHYFLIPITFLCQGVCLAQTGSLAIIGARIECGDGKVIENGCVVVRDGRITFVGEKPTATDQATLIDGKGLVVYPGFINGYSSDGLKIPDQPSYGSPPDARTTAPATMWHGNRKGVRADILAAKCLDVKSELSSNYTQGITTALLSSGIGTIRGTAAVVDYSSAGTVVQPAVGTELSFRSGSGAGYPGTLFGVIAVLRQTLADAQTYASDPAAKKDVNYDNLKPLVTHQIPAFFFADSAREIARASRLCDEFGLKVDIVSGKEAYRDIYLIKSKSLPVIVNIDPGFEPSVKVDTSPGSAPQEILNERHDLWVEHTQNVKKLNDAGVTYAFCTGTSSLSDFLANVRKLVTGGLPKEAALKALTSGAATILGVSDQVGTIEVGKRANLVIMSGDFADAKSEVVSVVVDGAKVDVKKKVAAK